MVITDITLENSDGLDLVKEINNHYRDLPVLILSMHDEFVYAERALRAGARGFIMKHEALELVVEALRQVIDGQFQNQSSASGNQVPASNLPLINFRLLMKRLPGEPVSVSSRNRFALVVLYRYHFALGIDLYLNRPISHGIFVDAGIFSQPVQPIRLGMFFDFDAEHAFFRR